MAQTEEKPRKRGPEAERLVLTDDWKAAVKRALGRGKPPKPPAKKKRGKKQTKKKNT